jgi:hypothetical protein
MTVDKWVKGYMSENPNEKELKVEELPTEGAKKFVMERITDIEKGIKSSDTTLTDKLWDIVMNGMQDETDYYTEFGDDKAVDIIYPKNHKEFTKEEQQGVFAYVIWVDEQGFKNTKIILEEKELESFLKWLGVGEGEDTDIEASEEEYSVEQFKNSFLKEMREYFSGNDESGEGWEDETLIKSYGKRD